jgi:hypothetical protein
MCACILNHCRLVTHCQEQSKAVQVEALHVFKVPYTYSSLSAQLYELFPSLEWARITDA